MLPPVIAGVDGSAESPASAEWAAREAVRRDRPLRLVHARNWHPRQENGEMVTAVRRHLARRVLHHAEYRIRRTCPGVRIEDQLVEVSATGALLKAADEHLLDERGNASTRTAYRDVKHGVDLADPCDEVIGFAFEEARLRRSRLKVVHARQHPSPIGLGPGEPGLMSGPERAGEWLGFLTAVLQVWRDKYPGGEVTETVVEGRPQSALLRIASGAACSSSAAAPPTVRRAAHRSRRPRHHPPRRLPVAAVPHD
ncbi:universal stress protein [Streptomyces griseorubiginosus]|uniref:universal stress protein n=1 Tax=Streptomyces griseorubiginosus TaxID=67304 RepID=UPI0036F09D55